MAKKPRKLANGVLAYPVAGDPPKSCPEGYMKDPTDPFICLPDCPCRHREDKIIEGCCIQIRGLYCNHFEEEININRCMECKERDI